MFAIWFMARDGPQKPVRDLSRVRCSRSTELFPTEYRTEPTIALRSYYFAIYTVGITTLSVFNDRDILAGPRDFLEGYIIYG